MMISSSGAKCFVSQFKWPTPIPTYKLIWLLRQMETNALFKTEYLFEPITFRPLKPERQIIMIGFNSPLSPEVSCVPKIFPLSPRATPNNGQKKG
jgi:hypothetical protein